MLATLNVKVPGVLGLGAGLTSLIVPLTSEPAGITTRPAAFLTSSTTRAVNASPGLALRDEIVSVAAMSTLVPAASRAIGGRAGGVGRRVTGGRVAGGGAAGRGRGPRGVRRAAGNLGRDPRGGGGQMPRPQLAGLALVP